MKNYADLDKRQRALVKLLRTAGEPGEALIDVVNQHTTYNDGGITTAVHSEERASRDARNAPAVCVLDCCESNPYTPLFEACQRHGVNGSNYSGLAKALLTELSENGKRAVAIVLDHSGKVKTNKLDKFFRAMDEAARRCEFSVRIVVIVTRIDVFVQARGSGSKWVREFPRPCEAIKPRARVWNWTDKALVFIRNPLAYRPMEEAPLLEQHDEERALKFA